MPRRRRRRGGGGGGGGAMPVLSMSTAMQTADPKSAYYNQMQKRLGINPFGTTDYNDWLQNDAYGMIDSLYGMAIQRNPNMTRRSFYGNFFKDPAAGEFLGPQGYAPFAAQKNPRDYYNAQAQAAGINLGGVSPYEKFMHDEGYTQASDAYGAANQRDPKLNFFQSLKPSSFKTSL